jgi:PEP-CTERM motif
MRKRLTLLGAALLMIAAPASADPFVLRAPSALDLDFEGNGFFFVADGFSARQDFESNLGLFFGVTPGCDPCNGGEAWNPSFSTTNTFMGTGEATVGNITHSDLSFFGDLSFDVEPFVFPPTSAHGFAVQTPFTFTGTLRGFEGNQLAFSVALTGAGFASRFFDPFDSEDPANNRFVAGENRQTYFFTDPAGQVPEPASLLLLGTGAAGLIARKRSKPVPASR